MAEKIKRVSINKLEKYVDDCAMEFIPVTLGELEFVVKPKLKLKEVMEFVRSVSNSCLSEESSDYIPEARDFSIRVNAFEYYTNLSLPSDINKKYDFVYGSDIFDIILENIDMSQFNQIMKSIDERIRYAVGMRISDVHREVNEMYAVLENLQAQFEDMFKGINPDELSGFINSVSGMNITEEGLVNAFKQNYASNNDSVETPSKQEDDN